jgi:predicted component of type VI protein secretion system
MQVRLIHSNSGLTKDCKVGFSWTSLFFGLFVPLVRGDLKWALISFVLASITLGLSWLVMPFIYNKIYIKSLLEKGYQPASEGDRTVLHNYDIHVTANATDDIVSSAPMSSVSSTQESSAPSPGFPAEVSGSALGAEPPNSSTQAIPEGGNVSAEANDSHTRILRQDPVVLAWLIEKGGQRPGRDHQLKEGRNSIGRQSQNDIVIEDKYASREHAVVVSRDGNFELQDLVSTHGTLLNGEKVVHGVLSDGDEIVVGKTTLVFKEVT